MSIATLESNEITANFKNDEEVNIQHQLVDEIAEREGFTDYDIEIKAINNKGGNYLGILYAALIRGKKDKRTKDLHLFIKVATNNPATRNILPLHDVYCSEIFSYKILAKLYNELQNSEGIPEQKRFRFPKFYGSIETDFSEALVLENLSVQHYTVEDRFQCISLDFAKMAVGNLAKFHALSYIAERRHPEYFDQFIRVRKGNMYIDNDGPERMRKYSDHIIDSFMPCLKNEAHKETIREFCKDMYNDIEKYVKLNKHQALCHGDYRGNNILVKYQNNIVQSMIAVDYQFIHFGSPLYDLYYFLYIATDRQFREKHLQNLINFYYKSLADFLDAFSYDVEDIYPRSDFDEDVKTHRIFGLIVGVHVLQFILAEEDNVPDLDDFTEESMLEMNCSKNKVYLVRANEIVEEFIDLGVPLLRK